jgi:hypothetical protein
MYMFGEILRHVKREGQGKRTPVYFEVKSVVLQRILEVSRGARSIVACTVSGYGILDNNICSMKYVSCVV